MNIQQTSKLTGIPTDVLLRMRDRKNLSLLSGPPFHKLMSKSGVPVYEYNLKEVREWMRLKRGRITAGDAATIMGVSREEILGIHGVESFRIQNEYDGRLVVNNTRNLYIWLPTKKR